MVVHFLVLIFQLILKHLSLLVLEGYQEIFVVKNASQRTEAGLSVNSNSCRKTVSLSPVIFNDGINITGRIKL